LVCVFSMIFGSVASRLSWLTTKKILSGLWFFMLKTIALARLSMPSLAGFVPVPTEIIRAFIWFQPEFYFIGVLGNFKTSV
jgi:hypothetical protein